ncbi:hypothetical protein [Lysinibacillus cavernae]|nr:hypothetical protein [Lysinibacillus cavernae]
MPVEIGEDRQNRHVQWQWQSDQHSIALKPVLADTDTDRCLYMTQVN